MIEENINPETLLILDEKVVLLKNPEVTIKEEMEDDGKYILYNAENELILVINSTGKFILDSCNGKKTIGQIIKDIENHFTIKEDMILSKITKEYISNLLKAKLVMIKELDN